MTRTTTVLILFAAAILEAGGDAIVRFGLRSSALWQRAALFAVAALVLFAYGWTVNRPPWDFGKLLGLYVVFFFVIAQIISWLAHHRWWRSHRPRKLTLRSPGSAATPSQEQSCTLLPERRFYIPQRKKTRSRQRCTRIMRKAHAYEARQRF